MNVCDTEVTESEFAVKATSLSMVVNVDPSRLLRTFTDVTHWAPLDLPFMTNPMISDSCSKLMVIHSFMVFDPAHQALPESRSPLLHDEPHAILSQTDEWDRLHADGLKRVSMGGYGGGGGECVCGV